MGIDTRTHTHTRTIHTNSNMFAVWTYFCEHLSMQHPRDLREPQKTKQESRGEWPPSCARPPGIHSPRLYGTRKAKKSATRDLRYDTNGGRIFFYNSTDFLSWWRALNWKWDWVSIPQQSSHRLSLVLQTSGICKKIRILFPLSQQTFLIAKHKCNAQHYQWLQSWHS